MKMTKRLMTMAMCGIMAATSMVSMGASAANINCNNNSIISTESENNAVPYAISKSHTISDLGSTFKQDDTNICWAACIQEVLRYYGVTETQENIVKERGPNGEYHNTGANYSEIKGVLNNLAKKKRKTFSSFTDAMATGDKVMAKVNSDKPVIMIGKLNGTGHALLCYKYDKSDSNNVKLYVICPNTDKGRKITLICDADSNKSFTSEDGKDTYIMSALVAES